MTRATKTKFRYAIIGAAVLIGLFVMFQMFGCAVGRSLDDDAPMVGLRLGDEGVARAAADLGGLVGGTLFGPVGAAVGTSLFGGLGALIWGSRQKLRGREEGWDQAVGKPAESRMAEAAVPSASAGGPSASRVGPVA